MKKSPYNKIKPFTLYKSKTKTKKWDVYLPTKSDRLKTIPKFSLIKFSNDKSSICSRY